MNIQRTLMAGFLAILTPLIQGAVVTLEASAGFQATSSETSFTDSLTFTSANNSLLVIGIANEANLSGFTVTYDPGGDNLALTQLVSAQSTNNSNLWVTLYAVEINNPGAGSRDFTITSGSSSRLNYVAYQLGNATLTGAQTTGSGLQDATLTVPSLDPGAAVIDLLIDGSHNAGGPAFGSPDGTIRLNGNASGGPAGSSNRGVISGWYLNQSGSTTAGYNEGAAQASVAAGFQAVVPEPSSLVLIGMAGLSLVVLRKRLT